MHFTTTAPDRRTLVRALAGHFDLEPAYNGPPTFSYSVGEITIDRAGTVAVGNVETAARLKEFLIQNEWLAADNAGEGETISTAAPAEDAKSDLRAPVMEVGCPLSEMSTLSLTNLIHMLYSKQYILARSVREDCVSITGHAISELHARNPQTVEEFLSLICDLAAQGHLKGIRASDEAVYIAFPLTDDETARDAFQKLGAHIFRFAKAAKRVQPDFQKPEAEKYHMRGWLLRLGLGGPANAAVRKVLLGHLAGCSAFPNAEQARRHAEKYAAIRREQRAAAQAAEAHAATQPIQEPLDAGETVPAESPENPRVKEVKAID